MPLRNMYVKRRTSWYAPGYHTGTRTFNRPKPQNRSQSSYSKKVVTSKPSHQARKTSKPPEQWIGANRYSWNNTKDSKSSSSSAHVQKTKRRLWQWESREAYNKANPKHKCNKEADWESSQRYWKKRHTMKGFYPGAKYGGVGWNITTRTVKKKILPSSWDKPVFVTDKRRTKQSRSSSKPPSTMSVDYTQAQNAKIFSKERTSTEKRHWKSQSYCTDGTPILPGFNKAVTDKVMKHNSEIVTRGGSKKKKRKIEDESRLSWFNVSSSDFDEW